MINIAYITSCREVGNDEKIGRVVVDPITGVSLGYRMGNLESLAGLLVHGENSFAQQCNLSAVFVDDTDEQWEAAWQEAELWPRQLQVPIRNRRREIVARPTLDGLTIRIPSSWRALRQNHSHETREEFVQRKAAAKAEYEKRLVTALQERNVSLIVSDSYVCIFGPHVMDVYRGRMLNIHPAITQVGNPNRLPGLTPTRDAYTRACYGYVIVDDKHAVDVPAGEQIEVTFQRETRRAVRIPQSYRHGVTVHEVTTRVDNGPVVLSREYDLPEDLTPERIRTINYQHKRELLPVAILQYTALQERGNLVSETRTEVRA
jgi:folate-dependent phosphoribosylglycinamide formyltransferase PurN